MYTLPHWNHDRFKIEPNKDLLRDLTIEMQNSMAQHGKPSKFWMLPDELVSAEMELVLNAWCGTVGELFLSDEKKIAEISGSKTIVNELERFIKSIDHLGIMENQTIQDLANKNWRYMDLGSLMDMLLLTAFVDLENEKPYKILEIGGGFGRLADFLFLSSKANLKYVNIDAVPVSLMYAYLYLKKNFPNKKVSIKTNNSQPEDHCDILILPAWHIDKTSINQADISINIESMQEMSQELVDFYFSYINENTCKNGLIYLVNSRDYKFQGAWNIPKNWRCILKNRTPRSWTLNHPVEIFINDKATSSRENMIRNAFYQRELQNCKIIK
jgi:putative sugar O-methyltransferase